MSTKPRHGGFACLSKEQRREISSMGGKAGGHRFTPDEARAAAAKPRKVRGKTLNKTQVAVIERALGVQSNQDRLRALGIVP